MICITKMQTGFSNAISSLKNLNFDKGLTEIYLACSSIYFFRIWITVKRCLFHSIHSISNNVPLGYTAEPYPTIKRYMSC